MRRVSKDVRRLREQSQNVPREVQSFRWGSGGMTRMLFVEEGRLRSPETCVGDPWDKLGPGDPVTLLEWMVGSVGSDEVTLLGSSCAVLGGGYSHM